MLPANKSFLDAVSKSVSNMEDIKKDQEVTSRQPRNIVMPFKTLLL